MLAFATYTIHHHRTLHKVAIVHAQAIPPSTKALSGQCRLTPSVSESSFHVIDKLEDVVPLVRLSHCSLSSGMKGVGTAPIAARLHVRRAYDCDDRNRALPLVL